MNLRETKLLDEIERMFNYSNPGRFGSFRYSQSRESEGRGSRRITRSSLFAFYSIRSCGKGSLEELWRIKHVEKNRFKSSRNLSPSGSQICSSEPP